jgi:NTP pyrophosphatase (non-canonical NTP hydrolase)
MTIEEAQQSVDQWIHQYGGGYFSELTNLGILTEEVGEMARWIVRKYGDQSLKPAEQNMDIKEAIEDEMTDILWVLLCLANQMQIDLTKGFEKNILKKINRDHSRHTKREGV